MSSKAMTATDATTFEYRSAKHAELLKAISALHGCTCEPYQDYFTYRRWHALGWHVKKGEHGTKLSTYALVTEEDEETGETTVTKRHFTSTVFCRCQVAPIKKRKQY